MNDISTTTAKASAIHKSFYKYAFINIAKPKAHQHTNTFRQTQRHINKLDSKMQQMRITWYYKFLSEKRTQNARPPKKTERLKWFEQTQIRKREIINLHHSQVKPNRAHSFWITLSFLAKQTNNHLQTHRKL